MPNYQAGKDILLKANFGQGGGFQTVGGIQSRRMTFPDTAVAVTNQDSDGNFREMIQGIGEDSLDFSGEGVLVSNAVMVQLLSARRERRLLDWQVIVPGLGTYEGPFSIGQIEISGDQSKEARFSINLMSAGPYSFTPNTGV